MLNINERRDELNRVSRKALAECLEAFAARDDKRLAVAVARKLTAMANRRALTGRLSIQPHGCAPVL